MPSNFVDEPLNFNVIEPYIASFDEICRVFCFSKKPIIFYDTCSFSRHSVSVQPKLIAEVLAGYSDLVFITRTVLMELSVSQESLHSNEIEYIKMLNAAGLKIYVLNEEQLADIIGKIQDYTNSELNVFLREAFFEMSKNASSISAIKSSLEKEKPKLFKKILLSESTLVYEDFFKFARSKKKNADSLAEDLILICFIILGATLAINPNLKCWLVSDDTRSFTASSSVLNFMKMRYLEDENKDFFLHLTTPRFIFMLAQDSGYTDSELVGMMGRNPGRDFKVGVFTRFAMEFDRVKTTPKEFVADVLSGEIENVLY